MAKKYTPFKMKGHTLPGINQRSEGDTDLPDGRSGSSPFQEKSPAKQRTWGGTESEKGNIFTKRGRTQRKINRYERSETKIIDKLNKSGKDKNTGAWEDKAVKKAVKKSEKRFAKTPENYQRMKKGAEVKINKSDDFTITKSVRKPAKSPAKLAPLVAMAGKAILGQVAGKVAGKIMGGKKEEE
jgi:hypothetical protein